MMTRRTCDTEIKLKSALQELKSSENTCQQLLRELKDSELEIADMARKHANLKKELSELCTKLEEVMNQRDHLQAMVDSYDHCRRVHESTLERIDHLERQLSEAHEEIDQLLKLKHSWEHRNSSNLYSELCQVSPNSLTEPIITIDLTNSPCHSGSGKLSLTSSNKIKRYIKINRFIKKTDTLIKPQKKYIKNVPLRREKIALLKDLETSNNTIEENKLTINKLYDKIHSLETALQCMTKRYESASNEISEHISAMNSVLNLKNCDLQKLQLGLNNSLEQSNSSLFQNSNCKQNVNLPTKKTKDQMQKVIIFSDEVGRGMGSLLSYFTKEEVVNYCMPGASIAQIINKIATYNFDAHCTIVLAIGLSPIAY